MASVWRSSRDVPLTTKYPQSEHSKIALVRSLSRGTSNRINVPVQGSRMAMPPFCLMAHASGREVSTTLCVSRRPNSNRERNEPAELSRRGRGTYPRHLFMAFMLTKEEGGFADRGSCATEGRSSDDGEEAEEPGALQRGRLTVSFPKPTHRLAIKHCRILHRDG